MTVIQTRINCNSEDFKKNYGFHQNLSIELKLVSGPGTIKKLEL